MKSERIHKVRLSDRNDFPEWTAKSVINNKKLCNIKSVTAEARNWERAIGMRMQFPLYCWLFKNLFCTMLSIKTLVSLFCTFYVNQKKVEKNRSTRSVRMVMHHAWQSTPESEIKLYASYPFNTIGQQQKWFQFELNEMRIAQVHSFGWEIDDNKT